MSINVISKYCKDHSFDNVIYIGRGSVFGNPYTHLYGNTKAEFKVGTRTESIVKYIEHFHDQIENNVKFKAEFDKIVERVKQGEDISLQCFCYPHACHGDYLVERVLAELGESFD